MTPQSFKPKDVASSPGHSHVFNIARIPAAALYNLEAPMQAAILNDAHDRDKKKKSQNYYRK